MKNEPTAETPELKKSLASVIDEWFEGHIKPMAHRFTADVYNDLHASKEALKDLL
jgi:hypothetical protein